MELLGRMNAKMDEGYKLTNFYCTFCNGVTLANPSDLNGHVYCPKCNKEYVPVKEDDDEESASVPKITNKEGKQPISQLTQGPSHWEQTPQKYQQLQPEQKVEEQDPVESQYKEFLSLYNSTVKTAQQLRSEQVSKKMGQKLIAGWAMMEEACLECNVPLMKSKNGNMICCGCDKDYMSEPKPVAKDQPKKEVNQPIAPQAQTLKHQQKAGKVEQKQKITLHQHPHKQDPAHVLGHSHHEHHHHQHGENQQQQIACEKIATLSCKTLDFLQKKLDQAFQLNDLEAVDRVLRSIKAVKELL